MSVIKNRPFYYCIVPCCKNTTHNAPEKIFLNVPKNQKTRDAWAKAMKRDNKRYPVLSETSTRHCCEDHFSLEEDLENYWRWKLTGDVRRLKLKKGVVPHIFNCQGVNMAPVEGKRPPKFPMLMERGVETTTCKKEKGETGTAKLKVSRIEEGAIPADYPSCSSKSTISKSAFIASQLGKEVLKSKKVKLPRKTIKQILAENVAKTTTVIMQEPEETTDESSKIVIDKVISLKELQSSNVTSYFPENAMSIVNSDSIKVDETSVATTPRFNSKRQIARSMYIRNSPRMANQAKLHRFAKSSESPSRSKMPQSVNESVITIKQEPIESTEEVPPPVIQNVLSLKYFQPFSSSLSSPENAMPVVNSDSTNVNEASMTTKPRIIRKRIVRSMYTRNSPRKNIEAKSHRRAESSVSPSRSKMSQSVNESVITIKQEPLESPLVIDNILSVKEHLQSNSSLYFPENVMPVVNQDETNSDEASFTTKPRIKRKEAITRSMYTSNSPRKATRAKLQRFAKSSVSSNIGNVLQSVTEPSVSADEAPVESTKEAHPLILDNVLSVKELLPSNSSLSFNDNALQVANPDLTIEDEASTSNKLERKINIVKPFTSNSTPSEKQAKLDLLANPSMLSEKSSISPTEATRNATKEIFLSLMNASGKNPSSSSRTSEKPGDLFDVFADFIADKLRGLHWDTCAVALRSILDIVLKAGEGQQSSDDDHEINISNTNTNSSGPSDEC